MPYVQVTVGFGRKAGLNAAGVFATLYVLDDDVPDKI
jgi:hypothetical protein